MLNESRAEMPQINDNLATPDQPSYRMMKKSDYATGTVGFTAFPAGLEGRERTLDISLPVTDLTFLVIRPRLKSVNHYFTEDEAQYLSKLEIKTLNDLLTSPAQKLKTKYNEQRAARIVETARFLFDNLTAGPEALLIADVFDQSPEIIPKEFDGERRKIVTGLIDQISADSGVMKKIILLRYGFGTGKCYTLGEIGAQPDINLTRERVRQKEAKILRRLRHPIRSRQLSQFLRFADTNLATLTWGVNFPCELQGMENVSFGEIPLKTNSRKLLYSVLYPNQNSDEINRVNISDFWSWYNPFKNKQHSVPGDVMAELEESLRRNFPLPHLKK